jgi:hypothetical protein
VTGTAVIGCNTNVRTGESRGWQQLRCDARAFQHDDRPTTGDQGPDDSGKDRNTEAAGEADRGPISLQVEALAERSQ